MAQRIWVELDMDDNDLTPKIPAERWQGPFSGFATEYIANHDDLSPGLGAKIEFVARLACKEVLQRDLGVYVGPGKVDHIHVEIYTGDPDGPLAKTLMLGDVTIDCNLESLASDVPLRDIPVRYLDLFEDDDGKL